MTNLIPEIMSQISRGLRSAYLSFDSLTSNMNEIHFALVAIVVIGVAVVLMRGKPVQGS